MEGGSLTSWEWLRRPDAKADRGFVVCGDSCRIYLPGEHRIELLNAILKVCDDRTAASFARQWGFLGFTTSAAEEERRRAELHGALELARVTERLKDPAASFEPARGELIFWHDRRPAFVLNLAVKSEPVQWIVEFAARMQSLSEVIHVESLYKEYHPHAHDKAAKWMEELTPELYQRLIGPKDLPFWEEEHQKARPDLYFHEFLFGKIIEGARLRFSHRSQRGVWVRVNPDDGQPVFEFDSLSRFIEYSLLSDNAPSPKRCADPQCRQLFFPIRSSRRYCPPPTGHKRSLCEQRHTRQLRRAKQTGKKEANTTSQE